MIRGRGKLIDGGAKIFAAVLVVSLAAVACGGSKAGTKTDAGNTTIPANQKAPGEKSEPGTIKRGGVMTVGLESESTGGWCLASGQLAVSGIQVHNAIYDPLAIFDENYVAKPYLAESLTPNADATLWTIKLRPGILFHDGTKLDSAVVKDNIDLWWGEPTITKATNVSPVLFRLVYKQIQKVTVVDDLTLTVSMSSPWPQWASFLASGRNGMMAEKQLRADSDGAGDPAKDGTCADTLVGTGPFKLNSPADWERNQQMKLVKNENYWRMGADDKPLPYLDGITFKPVENSENRFNALKSGAVDATHFSTQSIFDDIAAAPDKFNLVKEPKGHREVAYGLVDLAAPPFNDKATRLAIGQAIDRTALNRISNKGKFDIADQPFDTETLGYVEGLKLGAYDPATAKAFLQGKNISMNLTYATDPTTKLLAEEIKRQLGEVGVAVNIAETDQSSLITKALGGGFGVLLWRNHPGADPDTQLVWWRSGYLTNFSKINDPQMDKLLDEGRVETDPAKRKEIYQNISKLFVSEGYALWNWYTEWAEGTNKKVQQFGYNTLPDGSKGTGINWGWTYLTEAWMDPSK